ncbi:kinase-like protein [Backusella circina FSU 941]|nr:kinase-like protein [Backusella circina FSU 941]
MALSKHPNILRVYGSFVIGSKLYIVTPYLSVGSCLDIIKTCFSNGLDEISIATILRQSLEGICYLHKNGHIHRDVKAGNLLMDQQGNVLLADFGVSSSLSENGDVRKTFVGTPCWMAPEVMEQAGYDFKADIWSFGITAIELATGHAPFAKYPPMKVLMMTLSNAPPTLDRDHCKHKYSKAFKDMIDICLQKDPAKRPSAEKLMLHPFFKLAKRKDYLVKYILPSVPPLDQRPNKKVPKKSICSENTEQWDFDTLENSSLAAEPRVCQAQEKPRQTTVQFQEKPKPLQVTRMRSKSNEGSRITSELKRHISFGEVTISDSSSVKSPMTPVCESPSPFYALADNSSIPAVSKKSRFVVADSPSAVQNADHYNNNSGNSITQGANLAIPNDVSGVGLGISANGIAANSLASTLSVHPTEVEVKKGRFSVNQTPTLRSGTDSPYDLTEKPIPTNELKASPILRSSSQDSLQSERKYRFGTKVSTGTLPTNGTLEPTTSLQSTPLQSTPITRESSNGSVLSRESKVSRFSVEKNESSVAANNGDVTITPAGCLSPESRKKGRFELTGGTNTPNDNFKLDRENSFDQHALPNSPAISPNNTLLRGQSHRLTDKSTTHLVQGHLEYLLKQADIQKNILSELISGLPSHYLTQPTFTRGRTLSDAKRPTLPEDFQPKVPVHSIPNNTLSSDINGTIEHLQLLVITSFKEKDKLTRENEALRREVERLRRNQSNGNIAPNKNSLDQGGLSEEYYIDNTPDGMS